MKFARPIVLAVATLTSSGCAALSRGSLAPTPRPLVERSFELTEFVADHNRNAERIKSLTARPSIGVAGKKVLNGRADARLDLVRPRKFKLVLKSMGATKADIGSNDDEFWFWVQGEDKSIYWCNYDELDSTPLAVTYQPDWIIEALGLKTISADEAKQIKVREGTERGTTALIFPPTRNGAETYTRKMIVTNRTRRIKEHCIYAGNLQTLLAQAEVSGYKDFEAGSDVGTADADAGETCYLPERVKLEYKRDQLALDVLLKDVTINQVEPAKAAAYFVEPVIAHYERVNLAEAARSQPNDSHSTVRRTLPRPQPRDGVKLGNPTPVPDDDATVAPLGSAAPKRANRITSQLEELVTAPLPVPPETAAMSAAWSAGDAYPLGR